jgi:hypothetical protein
VSTATVQRVKRSMTVREIREDALAA